MSLSTRKLYVGNVPYAVTENDLRELFADYGEVLSVRMVLEEGEANHLHSGYGFVEMSTQREAEEALKALHNTTYKGRTLKLGAAHPKKIETEQRA